MANLSFGHGDLNSDGKLDLVATGSKAMCFWVRATERSSVNGNSAKLE
jgi:hypothetical protein